MSRVGKKPIDVPEKVEVTIKEGNVAVKGPRGELSCGIPPRVSVERVDGTIVVTAASQQANDRAYQGLARALIANMVTGVTEGFQKTLEIVGVGYRGNMEGKDTLVLELGYSHPIRYSVPKGIEIGVDRNVITVKGNDKQLVGDCAADIRNFRPPEPYKGKGVRYQNEYVRRKEGKKNA